jgi:hypothetical protein
MGVEPDDADRPAEARAGPDRAVAVAGEDEREAAAGDYFGDASCDATDDVEAGPRLGHDLARSRHEHTRLGEVGERGRQHRYAPAEASLAAQVVRDLDERRIHPRSSVIVSTSRVSLRRAIATIRPSPTHTSDAATAMTARANT